MDTGYIAPPCELDLFGGCLVLGFVGLAFIVAMVVIVSCFIALHKGKI
jgi:hypothetical protein